MTSPAMALKLYYVPKTRSTRARWMLEELGVPYELVRLDPKAGENKTPEYLRIHPLGHVPSLVDDGFSLFESAAICLYLADKFPEKNLAPKLGSPERGLCYQWICFAMTEIEPLLVEIAPTRMKSPSLPDSPAVQVAVEKLEVAGKVLEAALKDREFLLGPVFSAADVVVGSGLGWARSMGMFESLPAVAAYATRVRGRAAFKRATTD